MEITSPLLTRLICAGLVMVLLMPPSALAQDGKPDALPAQQSQGSQSSSPATDVRATSPTVESQPAQTSAEPLPDSPDAVRAQTNDLSQPSATGAQSDPQQPARKTQKPVGAAAAEVQAPTGEAAFKPAGAAIAPATQRRRRMLLIKVGALIGAGVAIGSVAALSSASPSRPPGSH